LQIKFLHLDNWGAALHAPQEVNEVHRSGIECINCFQSILDHVHSLNVFLRRKIVTKQRGFTGKIWKIEKEEELSKFAQDFETLFPIEEEREEMEDDELMDKVIDDELIDKEVSDTSKKKVAISKEEEAKEEQMTTEIDNTLLEGIEQNVVNIKEQGVAEHEAIIKSIQQEYNFIQNLQKLDLGNFGNKELLSKLQEGVKKCLEKNLKFKVTRTHSFL